ncbi:MAG: hypothetical protein NTW96_25980 [Planctomycetia bacterium]|nr:hypothetical protein [Planctomycetia bacterium]
MTAEVLDGLVLGKPCRAPVRIGGRAFSTWHEATIGHAERMVAIPCLVADPGDDRLSEIGVEAQWSALGPALEGLEGDNSGLWSRVAEAVRESPVLDPEEATAEIECEWASARAGVSATSETDEYSRERTPLQWAKLFHVHRDTFVKRCREGKIRARKLSDKSYRVHVDDLPRDHPEARKSVGSR